LKIIASPVANLLFWLIAAYVLIGTGPMFFPAAGSTVTVAALLWKIFGAAAALLLTLKFQRRSPGTSVLGLRPRTRTIGMLLFGALAGVVLVGAWAASFRLFVAFSLTPGSITPPELLLSLGIYLFGALLEELAFRGQSFVRLRQRHGTMLAVLLVSLAFGLLHLPGMAGVNAIKIVALTGLGSLLFCLAYLLSGSLWTAVGLHAGMNFMLHTVLGAGGGHGPSLLKPLYVSPPPAIDAGFWCFIVVQLAVAAVLVLIGRGRPAAFNLQTVRR
jgi:uncharacterized protein